MLTALVVSGCSDGSDDPVDEPPPCASVSTQTGDLDVSVGDREARLHVPDSLDLDARKMLVIDLHYFAGSGDAQDGVSGLRALADTRGFLVLQPNGVGSSWNAGKCCGTAFTDGVDDVGFVRDLIDAVDADYCLDPERVFATGLSNGGMMVHRLACDLSDRIRGVASVAAPLHVETCTPSKPVSVLHFHGTDDPSIPYDGGEGTAPIPIAGDLTFISAAESRDGWRDRNGCTDATIESFSQGAATCERHSDCEDGTFAELCTLGGGGHTWPSGGALPAAFGPTNTDIAASEYLLDALEAVR